MKKASALISILVVMIIVGIGTTAILQAMMSYANMKIVTINKIKAQYIAEAGMQYAIAQCRSGDFASHTGVNIEGYSVDINKVSPQAQGGSYTITVSVTYPGI